MQPCPIKSESLNHPGEQWIIAAKKYISGSIGPTLPKLSLNIPWKKCKGNNQNDQNNNLTNTEIFRSDANNRIII